MILSKDFAKSEVKLANLHSKIDKFLDKIGQNPAASANISQNLRKISHINKKQNENSKYDSSFEVSIKVFD
jgi:hypothetical protein